MFETNPLDILLNFNQKYFKGLTDSKLTLVQVMA